MTALFLLWHASCIIEFAYILKPSWAMWCISPRAFCTHLSTFRFSLEVQPSGSALRFSLQIQPSDSAFRFSLQIQPSDSALGFNPWACHVWWPAKTNRFGTVAILAQGTSWAVAVTQAFLARGSILQPCAHRQQWHSCWQGLPASTALLARLASKPFLCW